MTRHENHGLEDGRVYGPTASATRSGGVLVEMAHEGDFPGASGRLLRKCAVEGCGRAAGSHGLYCGRCREEMDAVPQTEGVEVFRGFAARCGRRLWDVAVFSATMFLLAYVEWQFAPWGAELLRMWRNGWPGGGR